MPDDNRKADLAKIHIARKDLKLSDAEYEAMILRASDGGKTSSGDLDRAERGRLLGALRKLGWKPKGRSGGRAIAGDPQSRMIRGLWIELAKAGKVRDSSEAALRAWVRAETGKSDPSWCDAREKGKLIEALKNWRDRPAAEGAS